MIPSVGSQRFLAASLLLTSLARASGVPSPSRLPQLPRVEVDTAVPPSKGKVLPVPAAGSLQAALERARPGDVIELERGRTFEGPFTLPRKEGEEWITVRPAGAEARLPGPGMRVDPSQSGAMPRLISRFEAVLTAASGAHHYRFVGVEIQPAKGAFLKNLVVLGSTESAVEAVPHHLIFERCYLHGDPGAGTRRGIALNSGSAAVIDSYLADFKEAGADSQAIAGWNGPGPYLIRNNYLEAAGENVMFGGADPTIQGLVPSDIRIERNHFSKPLSWKGGEAGTTAAPWTVKNLLELKNARRVLIAGNLFEHNWVQAQNGFAVLFTVRNENGQAPWSVVEDVTFARNAVRRAASGVNILGRDDNHASEPAKRILIQGNLFEELGGSRWGGGGTLFQILQGTQDLVIDHNTAFQSDKIVMAEGTPHTGFVFTNNIVAHNQYGIAGTGTGAGTSTLQRYFPGALVRRNVFVGGAAGAYPSDNFFVAAMDRVGFKKTGSDGLQLGPASPYRGAGTDGKDPGVDCAQLASALPPGVGSSLPGPVFGREPAPPDAGRTDSGSPPSP